MATLKITKILDSNVYTVDPTIEDITPTEQALIDDFGEPVASIGGVIDVTTDAVPLTMDDTSSFSAGDVVTGDTSGATGTVHSIAGNILYVVVASGTFQTETVNSNAATILIVGSPIKTFEVDYGVPPQSTADFTPSPVLKRTLPTTLNTTFISINGNLVAEAEANANDLKAQIIKVVSDAWSELLSKANNFEGVETYPL